MTARPLRPHQTLALDLLKASIRSGKKRPVLQAPTGFGKTRVGAEIVSGARHKGNRVTFCVPALSLINQTFEAFVQDGVDPSDMGIIQADHPWTRPHAPIQIASVQTLARRKFPITDMVVVDEAHIQHDIIKKWMADPAMAGKLFVALSATPWARGMALQWDDLLKPTSTRELIDQGYLSPFRVFAPSHPDLSKVKTIAGDYQEDQLADAMGQPSITADIVSTWLEKGPGEKTLCFCVNRSHAQKVHDAFEAAKVRVAYIDANTEREERESIGKALLRGDVQVVCNIGCLTTGIDWDVRCIILARPTKSEMLYVQIIGRGLRTADGKAFCLVLDHSDTTLRLGMVDEIDHDELDDGTKKKSSGSDKEERDEIGLPKACDACGCLVPPKTRECPACGHVRRPKCNVVERDGALAELERGGKRGRPMDVTSRLGAMPRKELWAEIRGMQELFGWSDGRTAHCYRDITGAWPKFPKYATALEPSNLLRGWVRAKSIAYAKAKAAKEGVAEE